MLYAYVGWCWRWWGECVLVCFCGWGGCRKNDFPKDSLKNRLLGAAENKFLGLPVSECHYGLGLKSFRVLHPSFSVHFLLASHQINMRLSLTSKSSQSDLLFTEITLRDLTCTTQLMRIMCFKIRLAEKLGKWRCLSWTLPSAWNVLSLFFCLANSDCFLRDFPGLLDWCKHCPVFPLYPVIEHWLEQPFFFF